MLGIFGREDLFAAALWDPQGGTSYIDAAFAAYCNFDGAGGRFGVRICADNALVEIDRSYAVKGADLVLFATQDWGPDALYRNKREMSRAMDGQTFLLEATHSTTEVAHRSVVVEPTAWEQLRLVITELTQQNREALDEQVDHAAQNLCPIEHRERHLVKPAVSLAQKRLDARIGADHLDRVDSAGDKCGVPGVEITGGCDDRPVGRGRHSGPAPPDRE